MSFRNDSSAESWEFPPRVPGPESEGLEIDALETDGFELDDDSPRAGAPDDEGLTFVSIDDEDEGLLDDDDDDEDDDDEEDEEDDEDDDEEDDEDEDPFLRLGEDGLDFDEEEF